MVELDLLHATKLIISDVGKILRMRSQKLVQRAIVTGNSFLRVKTIPKRSSLILSFLRVSLTIGAIR